MITADDIKALSQGRVLLSPAIFDRLTTEIGAKILTDGLKKGENIITMTVIVK